MKRIQLLSLLTAAILLLTSCVFYLPQEDTLSSSPTSVSNTDISHGEESGDNTFERVYFKDIEYTRPDFDEIERLCNDVHARIDEGSGADVIKEAFDKYCDALEYADSMQTLLSLQQSIDATDDAITAELNEIDKLMNECYEKYIDLCEELAALDYKDEVLDDWTERDFELLEKKAAYTDAEYTALTSRQTELVNEYISRMSSMRFEYKGKQYTFEEIYYMDGISDADYNRLLKEYMAALESIGELYVQLVNINKAIAAKAGYDSFADFCYENTYYRDYGTEEAAKLHALVKQLVAPKIHDLSEAITQSEYAALSRYYYKDGMLKDQRKLILNYLDEMGMSDVFADMEKYGYVYIGNDSKMQSGAYTTYIDYYDMPFIYICQNGGYNDMLTLLHEFGHFYPEYTLGDECADIIDVCEIQSQANEFLFLKYFDALGANARKGITKFQLIDAMYSLCYGCMYDEFQQHVYSGDYKTASEINDLYMQLCDEYNMEGSDYGWVEVGHNFQVPMYYISYAVSIVPALEIFRTSTTDRTAAIDTYHRLAEIKAGTGFNETLSQIGLASPFEYDTLKQLCDWIDKQFR